MKRHNFHSSLAVGKAGESLLRELWPDLVPLDGFESDFYLESTGELVEVKSDMYDAEATPNFFIELMSDVTRQKAGGPVQALYHGSSLWVYWFPKNRLIYIFETEQIVKWLATNSGNYDIIYIRNPAWTTTGIKVPRTDLQHLYKIFVPETKPQDVSDE